MWDGLKRTRKFLVFSALTIIALVISIITQTWVPVLIAVVLDVGVTGMMMQIDNGALKDITT